MGCSWFTYAGTFEEIQEGWLLIPEYAQEWAGTDKLKVKCGGDYADFEMAETPHDDKSFNFLDGNVLIGVFIKLYNGEKVDVPLKDCYYEEYKFPYENKNLKIYEQMVSSHTLVGNIHLIVLKSQKMIL